MTRIAVVTGAGRGIGLAIVQALVHDGFAVVAGSRTVSPALRDATPDVLEVDLATTDGADRLVANALDRYGGIDLLVNNVAGTSIPAGGFLALDDEAWLHTLNLTLMSAVRATRAALPSLLDRRGAVVNIGSVNARLPQPRLVAQSAAKAALSNLGKALAEEFGGRGLRVNTISPGPVWTDVWTSPGGPGGRARPARGRRPGGLHRSAAWHGRPVHGPVRRHGRDRSARGLSRLRPGGQHERFRSRDRRRDAQDRLNARSTPCGIPYAKRRRRDGGVG